MKSLILGLLALFTTAAFAANTPYMPEIADRFEDVEAEVDVLQALPTAAAIATDGTIASRIAKATWNVVTSGGSGSISLGSGLPANALIKQTWYRVSTQFTDSGTGSILISCEDSGNIIAQADITGTAAGSITTGVATGAASAMVDDIAAACTLTASVIGATQTAGVLTVWVEYVVF